MSEKEIIDKVLAKAKELEGNYVVYNAEWGGFGFAQEYESLICELLSIKDASEPVWRYSPLRHDKRLAALVLLSEEGEIPCVNGKHSSLSVEKIEGNAYYIDEYDGWESVVEPRHIRWVVIKEEA